jgi:hypothetical protein
LTTGFGRGPNAHDRQLAASGLNPRAQGAEQLIFAVAGAECDHLPASHP